MSTAGDEWAVDLSGIDNGARHLVNAVQWFDIDSYTKLHKYYTAQY